MKKYVLIILFLFVQAMMFGQDYQMSNDSISKPIIPKDRLELLKNVDLIFNMRFANDNLFRNGKFEESTFSNNQLRLEIRGKIHDKVYFRFRDRYTKSTDPGSRDNTSRSTDMAYIGIDLTPKMRLNLGKMSADWGGYEFDLNPIDILEYNDIIENADNFLTGVGATYQAFKNHSFGFQILNSRISDFEDVYKDKIPLNLEKAKIPMAYITNWRGSFFGGKLETIYSYSYFKETTQKGMNYYSLGHKYQDKKLTLMYDFKYSNEGVDRKGIITNMIPGEEVEVQQNVEYLENWIRAEYLIFPKVNLSLTLMNSNAYAKDIVAPGSGNSHIRSSYGYIPAVEYLPFKDLNIRFYISYVGRYYKYSTFAQEHLGQVDYNTGRLSIGFIAPLLVL
ncbi:porin [Flavobacterium cerinum]|uniref:OprO/OprP family phosphate-selective porin n=1 Tax=Flavobacterium cerinum TaxID=2502784 RepID=A0ABY5IWZ7_9FLAO|nr:porin [Flavobacterium cerinum]UUC47334.1 OprO/OprP family phosphate-selective porin [Flavobacterium cerinum]